MRTACATLFVLFAAAMSEAAAVDPVAIRFPESTAWTGQKISFYVDLLAQGSFDGTASFSIPKVPRSIIIKTGNPVVSSKEIDGDSWFVQTHEFALFSQQSGTLKIPAFEVRFAARNGFTGPSTAQTATVPESSIEIRRPPGSEQLGFLVTTESLDIEEAWKPRPGATTIGAVFERTISQNADEMTGIALPPPPETVPDGVRLYQIDPDVADKTERGQFAGSRKDKLTYVMQQPGTHTLPAITYVWWNPKSEKLLSKTLPAVTFEVAAPPPPQTPPTSTADRSSRIWWLCGVVLIGGLIVWQRQKIAHTVGVCWHRLYPPDRAAAGRLLRACRRNDAADASQSWLAWLDLQDSEITAEPKLDAAATELLRHQYGPQSNDTWQGDALATAFREHLAKHRRHRIRKRPSHLPTLNPTP